MSDQEQAAPEAPKKSKKMLMIIVIAVVVLAGGGAGAFFMLKGDSKAEAAPAKGVVVSIDEAVTVNLAEGHYLKLKFSLQQTADAAEEVDTSEALNLAIETYTDKTIAQLSTEKGRNALKEELLQKIIKAYTVDGTKEVMDIYFTQFVTQ